MIAPELDRQLATFEDHILGRIARLKVVRSRGQIHAAAEILEDIACLTRKHLASLEDLGAATHDREVP